MHLTTTLATLLTVSIGFVAAQSPTNSAASSSSGSSSGCAAQYIVDACLGSTTPQLQACQANDWKCLCEQSNNVLTCYNNCPGDANRFGAQQTMTSYCNAAKAYDTSSSSSSSSSSGTATLAPSASASSKAASSASATSEGSDSSAATSTGSGSSSAKSTSSSLPKNAAVGGRVIEAGTLVAGLVLAGLGVGVAL